MWKASSLVTWIVGLCRVLWLLFLTIFGNNFFSPLGITPGARIAICLSAATIVVLILFGRERALCNGEKSGFGLLDLLFVSFLGGLLTLLIPDSELPSPYKTRVSRTFKPSTHKQTASTFVTSLQEEWDCPVCFHHNKQGILVCPECGYKMEIKVKEKIKQAAKKCGYCGKEISNYDTECPHCGHDLM